MAAVAAPEIKVEVSIGEASKLDVGKAPTPPITVPPALQNSIVESDSADTFGEVSFPPAQDLEEAVAEQKEKEEAQKEEEQEEQTEESSAEEESPEKSDEVTSSETNNEETSINLETESKLKQPEIETIEGPEIEDLDFIDDILEDTSNILDSIQETEKTIKILINREQKNN